FWHYRAYSSTRLLHSTEAWSWNMAATEGTKTDSKTAQPWRRSWPPESARLRLASSSSSTRPVCSPPPPSLGLPAETAPRVLPLCNLDRRGYSAYPAARLETAVNPSTRASGLKTEN